MESIKYTAQTMYKEYMTKHGKKEGTEIINRYLNMQANKNDPEENEFCKELYRLTEGSV